MGANVEELTNTIVAGLRDSSNDSWPEQSIWGAILEAEKVITNFRPDATATDADFTCAAGHRQDLSTMPGITPLRFLDAQHNGTTESPGRTIRVVDQGTLNRLKPDWRAEAQGNAVRQVMYDERFPLVFLTYPPIAAGTVIHIGFSREPADYGNVDGNTETTVSGVFSPMILECALYRLLGHDVEGSVNVSRSQQHWNNFQAMMGIKIEADKVFGPKNPEHKR